MGPHTVLGVGVPGDGRRAEKLPLYELACPHCGTTSAYTFTIGTGAGVLKCPQCKRSFQVELKGDAVVKVRG